MEQPTNMVDRAEFQSDRQGEALAEAASGIDASICRVKEDNEKMKDFQAEEENVTPCGYLISEHKSITLAALTERLTAVTLKELKVIARGAPLHILEDTLEACQSDLDIREKLIEGERLVIVQDRAVLTNHETIVQERESRCNSREIRLSSKDKELKGRADKILHREDELASREDYLIEREQEVTTLEQQVCDREDDVAHHEDTVVACQLAIMAREEAVAVAESRLAGEQAQLDEQDFAVARRDSVVSVDEDAVREREGLNDTREQRLLSREQALAHSDYSNQIQAQCLSIRCTKIEDKESKFLLRETKLLEEVKRLAIREAAYSDSVCKSTERNEQIQEDLARREAVIAEKERNLAAREAAYSKSVCKSTEHNEKILQEVAIREAAVAGKKLILAATDFDDTEACYSRQAGHLEQQSAQARTANSTEDIDILLDNLLTEEEFNSLIQALGETEDTSDKAIDGGSDHGEVKELSIFEDQGEETVAAGEEIADERGMEDETGNNSDDASFDGSYSVIDASEDSGVGEWDVHVEE